MVVVPSAALLHWYILLQLLLLLLLMGRAAAAGHCLSDTTQAVGAAAVTDVNIANRLAQQLSLA
jgi:hypothetical protein